MMFVSFDPAPRKFGPPESPKQVPPLPVAGFCEIRNQAGVTAFNVPVETNRTSAKWNVCPPGSFVTDCAPYPTEVNCWAPVRAATDPALGSRAGAILTALSRTTTAVSCGSLCAWSNAGSACPRPVDAGPRRDAEGATHD